MPPAVARNPHTGTVEESQKKIRELEIALRTQTSVLDRLRQEDAKMRQSLVLTNCLYPLLVLVASGVFYIWWYQPLAQSTRKLETRVTNQGTQIDEEVAPQLKTLQQKNDELRAEVQSLQGQIFELTNRVQELEANVPAKTSSRQSRRSYVGSPQKQKGLPIAELAYCYIKESIAGRLWGIITGEGRLRSLIRHPATTFWGTISCANRQ